jgi:hypothetical protein
LVAASIDFEGCGPIPDIMYKGMLSNSTERIKLKNSLEDTTNIPPTNDNTRRKQYSSKYFFNWSVLELETNSNENRELDTRRNLIILVVGLFSKVAFKYRPSCVLNINKIERIAPATNIALLTTLLPS